MASTESTHVFLIFFVNKPDIPDARRLVRMRQYIEEGLGADITHSAILVVRAPDIEAARASVVDASTEFDITVIEPYSVSMDDDAVAANFCMLASADASDILEVQQSKGAADFDAEIQIVSALPDGHPFDSISLLKSPDHISAHQYADACDTDNCPTMVLSFTSISEYLDNLKIITSNTIEPLEQQKKKVSSGLGTIYNSGDTFFNFSHTDDTNVNADDLMKSITFANLEQTNRVNPYVNFYTFMDTKFSYKLHQLVPKGRRHARWDTHIIHLRAKAWPPAMVRTITPGSIVHYNLESKEPFRQVTQLKVWLNQIFNTTTYDGPWPDESYNEAEMAAYKYILNFIKETTGITAPPKDGTMAPSVIGPIPFPDDQSLDKTAFEKVKLDQSNICTWAYDYANVWFGGSGLFHSLISDMTSDEIFDLTIVSNLLKVPNESKFSMILDAIMNDILYFIGAVPKLGGILEAVLNLAWTTARLTGSSGEPKRPIEVSIANVAQNLQRELSFMKGALAVQLGTIKSNWGKLQTFAVGAINHDKIDPSMFGMQSSKDTPDTPRAYKDAMTKAWRATIYKALMPSKFRPKCTLSIVDTPPPPTFNRSQKKYFYSCALKCTFRGDSQKELPRYVYLTYTLHEAAPELLDDLFAEDKLNLNPVEFYLGYNGWQGADLPDYKNSIGGRRPDIISIDV